MSDDIGNSKSDSTAESSLFFIIYSTLDEVQSYLSIFKTVFVFKSDYCQWKDKAIVLYLASCHHSVKAILILEDS